MQDNKLVLASAFETLAREKLDKFLTLEEFTALIQRYTDSENKSVEAVFDEYIQATRQADNVSQEDMEACAEMGNYTKQPTLFKLQDLAKARLGYTLGSKACTKILNKYGDTHITLEGALDEFIKEQSLAMISDIGFNSEINELMPKVQALAESWLGHTLDKTDAKAVVLQFMSNSETLEDTFRSVGIERGLKAVDLPREDDNSEDPFVVVLKVELVYEFSPKDFPAWFNERGVNAGIDEVLNDLNRPVTLADLGEGGIFGQGPREILVS